jgi:Arc/MetJ family transcription regulator
VGEVAGSNPVVPTIFPSKPPQLAVNLNAEHFCNAMKLRVEIDDNLMKQAMRSGRYRTKKAAIEAGLRLLVLGGQSKIRRLRGKIAWDGNLEESRRGRNTDQ